MITRGRGVGAGVGTSGERRREAFGRSMMLVAIYSAATGRDRVPGYDGSITRPYLRELAQGADPTSPYRWKPSIPQSVMGTCAAMAILISPQFLWDPLTPARQSNVLDMLENLAARPAYHNNHWYFHLLAAGRQNIVFEGGIRMYTEPQLEKAIQAYDQKYLPRLAETVAILDAAPGGFAVITDQRDRYLGMLLRERTVRNLFDAQVAINYWLLRQRERERDQPGPDLDGLREPLSERRLLYYE